VVNGNLESSSREPLIYSPNGAFTLVTYQGSYTGLVNWFLNRYDANGNPAPLESLWNNSTAGSPSISVSSNGQYALIYRLGPPDLSSSPQRDIMIKEYSYADVPSAPYSIDQSPDNLISTNIGLSSYFFVAAWDQSLAPVTSPVGPFAMNSIHRRLPLSGVFDQGSTQRVCFYGCGPPNACQRHEVIGTPSVPGYTYSWSPTTYLSNPNVAQPTVTHPGGPATFSITYTRTTSSLCFQQTETVVVTFDPGCL
jgi:hypothetical protein